MTATITTHDRTHSVTLQLTDMELKILTKLLGRCSASFLYDSWGVLDNHCESLFTPDEMEEVHKVIRSSIKGTGVIKLASLGS